MTDEYIRRQDAFDAVNHALDRETLLFSFVRKVAISALKGLHAADVVQVVHGKWIEEWWHGEKTRKCSVCNLTQTVNVYNGEVKFKYCPYCGAKMDKE